MEENKFKQGKVTEKLFGAVKICLESGNSVSETSRFMKLTKGVVSLIRDSESYEDYKHMMYERAKACHAKRKEEQAEAPKEGPKEKPEDITKEVKTTVTVQATKFMEDKIAEGVDLLKGISAKLAVIIDDLYGTKGA